MVQCKAENNIPFPMQNVCFIAINDGVDSAKGDDDFTPVDKELPTNQFLARSQLADLRELTQWSWWDYSTTAPSLFEPRLSRKSDTVFS